MITVLACIGAIVVSALTVIGLGVVVGLIYLGLESK